MLVRFNVGNFLSFKEVQEFSLLKGRTKNKSDRVYDNKKVKLLKFASIFGANASGKSNLITSMMYAQNKIISRRWKNIKSGTFKLDSDYKERVSYFEFEILIKDKLYSYGFEILIDKNEFVSEWLIELSSEGNDKVIFSRNILKEEIEVGLKISSSDLRKKLEVYSDDIKGNKELLFLKEMNRAKSDLYKKESELSIFKDVYTWFVKSLDVNYLDRPISNYSYFSDVENKEEICRVIKALGTGITNFKIEESSIDEIKKDLPKELSEKLEEDVFEIIQDKEKLGKEASISIRLNEMYYLIFIDESNKVKVNTIVFNHGCNEKFAFTEESDGTRRILDLIEILFSNEDKTYIIDEIDRSLHPQLTYKFIKEFLAVASKRNTQLIITTHESRLLDFKLLRQDEIWKV
jgi:AAA15 family ATPase/GTPase